MKTRTMAMHPDAIRVDGNVWAASLPELVFEEYGSGGVVRRIRVKVRPIDVQEIARKLWELHAKYEQEARSISQCLQVKP